MPSTTKQAAILVDEASAGSLLLAVAGSKLPDEWLQWDPEVIRKETNAAFGVSMPDRCFNKLMAAVAMLNSDDYWQSLGSFVILNNALYSGTLNIDIVDIATMDEIAVGLSECVLIYPTDASYFSRTVIDYINAMRAVERFSIPPTIVRRLFGDFCPIWQDDFTALAEDPQLYAAAYQSALDKAAAVDDEVLGRLKYSVEQAEQAEMEKTAEYISRLVTILSEQFDAQNHPDQVLNSLLAETPHSVHDAIF